MKSLSLLLFFTFISSCARYTLTKRLTDGKNDSFQSETFIRFTKERLTHDKKSLFTQEIFNCYNSEQRAAYKTLKSKLEINLKKPEYWNTYGLCYYLDKDYPKADYFFQLAISYSNGHYKPALNNFAMSQYQQGHITQALELFSQLAHKKSNLRVPKFNLAQIYLEYNQLPLAIDLLNELEHKQAGDPDVLIALGTSHLLNNDLSQASFYFNRIDISRSQHLDIVFLKALMAFDQKKWKEAIVLAESINFTQTLVLKRFAKRLIKIANAELVNQEYKKEAQKLKDKQIKKKKVNKAKS